MSKAGQAREVVEHMLAQGRGRIIGMTTSMDTMYRKGGTPARNG